MKKELVVLLLFSAAFSSQQVIAESSLDDLLGAFEDDAQTKEILNSLPEPGAGNQEKLIEGLTGSLAISTAYAFQDHHSANGTDWKGFSKLRSRLNLQYDHVLNDKWDARASGYTFYDGIYALRDRDDYSNQVLSAYEKEAEIQELWILGKIDTHLDIKIGRQIVNWGRADSLRVLDILNPLDNREPGLADIEDLRLPVTMIKTDYYLDENWSTSFVVIPEVRFSKNTPYGSDYWVDGSAIFKENKPEDVSDSSYAASMKGIFSGWDVSFQIARYWRDTPYLKPVFTPGPNPLEGSTFEHSRITMLGAGGNYTMGPWLFMSEVALFDGIDYTLYTDQGVFGTMPTATTKKNRVDALVGVEYFGIANTTFSIELAHQYIPDFKDEMTPGFEKRNTTGMALRATHSMLNDRLDLTAVIFGNFGEAGGGTRFDAEYDLKDALVLSGGVIYYTKGDAPPFDTYYKNGRLFAELKYSF